MKVMVTGATGFIGGHIVDRLLECGHKVQCLVRSREKAGQLASRGVTIAEGDVSDLASVARASADADAAIHLVGIIDERPGATFEAVHVDGTRNVVLGLKESGVGRLIHMSALGTHHEARSRYHQTKWRAEEIVKDSGLNFTILRPSITFGPGDGFTSTIADLIRRAPVVPIIGSGKARYQPVWVEDVSFSFVECLERVDTIGHTYDLCGPEIITFEEYVCLTMEAMGIGKPKMHIPVGVMTPAVRIMQSILRKPPLTIDKLLMSQEDNICSSNAMTHVFCRTPARLQDIIKDIV